MRRIARARQAAAKALGERQPVGIVAHAAALAQHDGVDRPQRAGVVGQVREERQHRLLAGVGDVETGEAHFLGGAQEIGQRVRPHPKQVEVDPLVQAVHAVFGSLPFVHGRSERGLNARPDQTQAVACFAISSSRRRTSEIAMPSTRARTIGRTSDSSRGWRAMTSLYALAPAS